eukprot:8590112-Karenia_brevis.AAC.1
MVHCNQVAQRTSSNVPWIGMPKPRGTTHKIIRFGVRNALDCKSVYVPPPGLRRKIPAGECKHALAIPASARPDFKTPNNTQRSASQGPVLEDESCRPHVADLNLGIPRWHTYVHEEV